MRSSHYVALVAAVGGYDFENGRERVRSVRRGFRELERMPSALGRVRVVF
jgi:hypothetical protein